MRFVLFVLLLSFNSWSYVPTVESLFRHGNNPDITTNALALTVKLTSINSYAEHDPAAAAPLWIKWSYNVTPQGHLKLTQLLYRSAAMTESSLVDKTYVADLTPQTFGDSPQLTGRGLLFSMLNSLLINDGVFMVKFLRSRGINVHLNGEIVNQDKRSLLGQYRAWLIKTKGGRANSGEDSPLSPTTDNEKILASPMYLDTKQVTLSRYQGEPAWSVKSESFEAWVTDANREIRQLSLNAGASNIDIQCRDYLLFNGVTSFPKTILVKGEQDQFWQLEVLGIKTFNETMAEMLARLRRLDQVLLQRKESVVRPVFLF